MKGQTLGFFRWGRLVAAPDLVVLDHHPPTEQARRILLDRLTFSRGLRDLRRPSRNRRARSTFYMRTSGDGSFSGSRYIRDNPSSTSIRPVGRHGNTKQAQSISPTPNSRTPAGNGCGRHGMSTCLMTWTKRAGNTRFRSRQNLHGTGHSPGSTRLFAGDGG